VHGGSAGFAIAPARLEGDVRLQDRIGTLESDLRRKNSIVEQLERIDVDNLTPKQAHDLVCRLKSGIEGSGN
jgi:hypothetical protein